LHFILDISVRLFVVIVVVVVVVVVVFMSSAPLTPKPQNQILQIF
jgi:hypothetical protein